MSLRHRPSLLAAFVGTLAITLFIVSCGPAGGQGGQDGWTDVTADQPTGVGDALVSEGEATALESSETDSPGISVAPGTQEVDANGVAVGFTSDGFPFRGDPRAPIVMEEYSDYQCPFCSRFFQETLPSIEDNQIANGEVVLVFYDFPLPSHPQAPQAHQAAYCAGEEGAVAYWAMHDALFGEVESWSGQPNTTEIFTDLAANAGLEADAFRDCLESGKFVQRINDSVAAASQRGVNSTPSFFINGQALTGAQPLAAFDQAIETVKKGGQLAGAQPAATASPGVAPTPAALNDNVVAALGDPNAAVTIVEFTDFQCPYCARHAQQTLPQLIEQYIDSGDVYYVIKDFPLDSIHPKARSAAVAARCAEEQGAFWKMHDELFSRQASWAADGQDSNAAFVGMAADIGLDTSAFEQCLDSGRHDSAIEANAAEGRSLGVNATPTFFINGYPVPGAQPLNVFDFAIGLAAEGRLGEAYLSQEEPQQAQPDQPVEVPLGNAPRVGEQDAPVVIVEYTDFQCPYCSRHFHQTYPQILENYVETGQVLYAFKDFPLTSIHPQAMIAAEAARCARDQGAYLQMHDMLFGRQSEWSNQSDAAGIFVDFAGELDLDVDVFASCLENHVHRDSIAADLAEGSSLGVRGTPGFFLNGHFLSGAQPYQVFEQAIQQLAAEAQ
ncbi:MAG TPA: thioredoxin domain-containing protein [Candidatus Binatia bacterium]|nr:thioredoxin domain-containing protein [Candidatus Binatia bacterium]